MNASTRGSHPSTIDGHDINLTNLDKVLYPETGTTKGDIVAYYTEVAPFIIAAARDRPATRKRWVHGVGTATHPGDVFFQKNLDKSTPQWVARQTLQHQDHANDYPLVNDVATLVWLAQIAALEIHVPQWRFGADGHPSNPDRLILDLDPGDGAGLRECVEVAQLAREQLAMSGLDVVPVTSGSKGLHLYAALDGSRTSEEVSDLAHDLASTLEAEQPDLVVATITRALRPGKVFVDWSQNSAAKTTIVPYSLRGRAHPTVAAPRTWKELESSSLAQLEYIDVLKRIVQLPDPFAAISGGQAGD